MHGNEKAEYIQSNACTVLELYHANWSAEQGPLLATMLKKYAVS